MQQPGNRQEFLRMQAQAAAEARDMQRRATLPVPSREGSGKRQEAAVPPSRQTPQQPRRAANQYRIRPQQQRQEAGDRKQEAGYTAFKPYQPPKPEPPPPPPKPRQAPPPPPKPGPPPPPASPPLSDLFRLFGNLGGGNAANQQAPPQAHTAPPGDAPAGDGMDSILPLLLMLLLKKENADQGLLMALMYILM